MLRSSRQRRSSCSILYSAIENLESRTLFSAGLLDTAFNLIGKQTARYSDTTSDGVSVRFQADHKAIVVGDVQNGTKDAFISRWNEDGTPDTTYGVDLTKHATFLDLGHDEIATDVDIQSDGKAVVCGITGTLSGNSPSGSFFVARYNTDGTLDTTFDAAGAGDTGSKPGVRVINFGVLSGASGIMIDQSTGRITVVGIGASSTGGGIAIAFLKPDGTFDTSVGGGVGHVLTSAGLGVIEGATDVVPGPSGHFYVSGFSVNVAGALFGGGLTSQFLVAEFNSDGTLTTAFGNGGRATSTFFDQDFTGNISLALGVAYDPTNGKVGAAGAYADGLIDLVPPGVQTGSSTGTGHAQHADFALAQFNATTGVQDPGFFNGHGEAISISDNGTVGLAGASDVLYQPDGKLAAAGGVEDASDSNNSDFVTVRLNTNGSFDNTFGPDQNGLVITDFDQHSDGAFGMRLQTWDNKIYEVGHTKLSGTNGLVALVRYTPDGAISTNPVFNINDISITEGNFGNTTGSFTVTLANPAMGTVTVDYTTAPGTANLTDYALTSGTLTFAPGETSKTIPVTVFGDTQVEPDENFFVILSNPTGGATTGDATGTATILNDDTGVANNNPLKISTITFAKFPSLIVGGAKNATGIATVTLKNTGAKSLSGAITVNVYASLDQAFSKALDKVVGTTKMKLAKPLGKNQTIQVNVKVTIPKYSTDSKIFLIATVQGPGVTDVNGSAVASSKTLQVKHPAITLVGSTTTLSQQKATSNAQAKLTFPLKNTGTSEANGTVKFDVQLFDATGHQLLYYFFDNGSQNPPTVNASVDIQAGKSTPVTIKIKLPPASGNGLNHLAAGTYLLMVKIHKTSFNPANTTDGTTVAMIPLAVS